jgi:excisionase family DNA binding protein
MTDNKTTEWSSLPLVLTTEQVAEILQVDHRTVTNYCQRNIIPAFKIGNHWRISKEALKKFVGESDDA